MKGAIINIINIRYCRIQVWDATSVNTNKILDATNFDSPPGWSPFSGNVYFVNDATYDPDTSTSAKTKQTFKLEHITTGGANYRRIYYEKSDGTTLYLGLDNDSRLSLYTATEPNFTILNFGQENECQFTPSSVTAMVMTDKLCNGLKHFYSTASGFGAGDSFQNLIEFNYKGGMCLNNYEWEY